MYATAPVSKLPTDPFQATFAFAPSDCESRASSPSSQYGLDCASGLSEPGLCTKQTPKTSRLIRSVVEEAGLGRFVYLQGKSGRRYVFSSISKEQVSLYDNALFAVSNRGGEIVEVGEIARDLTGKGDQLYVHLLDDATANTISLLLDLDELAV